MNDPRDAPLAVAWADYLDRRRSMLRWAMLPRERPHGKRAWLWLIHLALVVAALASTSYYLWVWFPAPWRYFTVAWIAYCVATTPVQIARTLRSYWNAPRAAAANRACGSGYRT